MKKLIVFLGNPGTQYKETRHNTGWLVSREYFRRNPEPAWQTKFHSLYCKTGENIFLKPQTYMNESGTAVREAADFFGIKAENILVVHDDIELKFGEVRQQLGGGMGGHNGLRSIKQHMSTDKFLRLRIGIGRPEQSNLHIDVASWVLGRFTEIEKKELENTFSRACDIISCLCKNTTEERQ